MADLTVPGAPVGEVMWSQAVAAEHPAAVLWPGLDSAAALSAALFCDSVSKAALVSPSPVVYHDGDVGPLSETLSIHFDKPPTVEWRQAEGSLGDRMSAVPAPCLIIGADTPTLPVDFLNQAAARILDGDVVLGPAIDGGDERCVGDSECGA